MNWGKGGRGRFLGQNSDSPVLKISTLKAELPSQHSDYELLTKPLCVPDANGEQDMLKDLAISCDVEI